MRHGEPVGALGARAGRATAGGAVPVRVRLHDGVDRPRGSHALAQEAVVGGDGVEVDERPDGRLRSGASGLWFTQWPPWGDSYLLRRTRQTAVRGVTAGTRTAAPPAAPTAAGVVGEGHVVAEKDEREVAGRAVALLGDDDVGDALALGLLVVELLAVEEDDDVGVLLDRARVAQVGQLRLAQLALALLRLRGTAATAR